MRGTRRHSGRNSKRIKQDRGIEDHEITAINLIPEISNPHPCWSDKLQGIRSSAMFFLVGSFGVALAMIRRRGRIPPFSRSSALPRQVGSCYLKLHALGDILLATGSRRLSEDSGCMGACVAGKLRQLHYKLALLLPRSARIPGGKFHCHGPSLVESEWHVLSTLSQ